MNQENNPEIEPIEVTENITLAEVRAANPKTIYYAANTCWWTHNSAHLSLTPGTKLPCDPRGSVLFQDDDVEGFLANAEANLDHYGKHGLRAFIAAHHQNAHLNGRPWSARSWDSYNAALNRLDLGKRLTELKSDLGKRIEKIGKPEDIPLSTDELVVGLKSAPWAKEARMIAELRPCSMLEAAEIANRWPSSAFPIAVLIRALRQRDQEIANFNLALNDEKEWNQELRVDNSNLSLENTSLKSHIQTLEELVKDPNAP